MLPPAATCGEGQPQPKRLDTILKQPAAASQQRPALICRGETTALKNLTLKPFGCSSSNSLSPRPLMLE
jgi:hypothetical protein